MTRPKRALLVVAGVVLALAAAELGFQWLKAPVGCVKVNNAGNEPIEDLVLTAGGNTVRVGRVPAGESVRVFLSGRSRQRLQVNYRQKGNAMTGFVIEDFNPAAYQRERFMLVLTIRPNEYERYMDDGDPSLLARLSTRVEEWLRDSLESP
jgi:hypothetical protein